MNRPSAPFARGRAIMAKLGRGDGILAKGLSSLALRLAGMGMTFLLGVILARVLGPAQFGIYGLVTGGAAMVMMVALLGTPQTAVRDLSVLSARGDWSGVKYLIRQFAVATWSMSVALGAIAVAIAWWFDGGTLGWVEYVLLGAVISALMVTTTLIAAELRGLGAMFRGQVIDILVRPACALVVVNVLVVSGIAFQAREALLVQIAVGTLVALISLAWIRRILPAEVRQGPVGAPRPWLRAALPLAAVDVLRQLDGTYGMLLVGAFASEAEVGLFRVALSCAMVVGMPVSIFHIVQAPTVSKLHDAGRIEELQHLLSRTSAALVGIVALIVAACWQVGRQAIVLVFGAEYAGSWLPLLLLCIGQLCFAVFGMGPILLAMCHGERQLIRIYLLSVGAGIAAAIPLTIEFGASGAAAALILSMTMIGMFSWRYGRRIGVDLTFLPLITRKWAPANQ